MLSDVQFTQYELPIVELEIGDDFDQSKVEKFQENCLAVVQTLNIHNITVNFLNRFAIDRFFSVYAQQIEGINLLAKMQVSDFAYTVEHYRDVLTTYSDIILTATAEELDNLTLEQIPDYLPILQVSFQCNEAIVDQIDHMLGNFNKLDGLIKFLLLEPDYRTELDFKGYNMLIDKIYNMAVTVRVFLERGNLPVHILRKHPCNAYILSCASCHSGKKDLPRLFTIKSDGRVFPEGMDEEFGGFMMGNIFDQSLDTLLDTYRFSESHLRFKEACRWIYHEYVLSYPFAVLPWRYFFVQKARQILAEVNAHD